VHTDESGAPTAVERSSGSADVVESINEMWRIDDEWWRQPISRQYFEVMLESGRRVVIFQDLVAATWFMQNP